jgi:hypothetical protein
MNNHTSKGLRITLLVYAIYYVVWGLLHVFFPGFVQAKDPPIERILGAAMIAFAFGAGLAYLEKNWDRVKIMILTQAAWMILYTICMALAILEGGISAEAWIPTIIGVIFMVLFITLYMREERIKR